MSKIVYIGRDLIEKGESFVIAKVVETTGSTPRKKGAWLLMREDGTRYGTVGGGKLEAEVERLALEAFQTKGSKLHQFRLKPEEQQGLDMRCGGDADVLIEYVDAAKPETSAESIFAAISKDMRVRVLFSKNIVTTDLPLSVGTFLMSRERISFISAALLRIRRISSLLIS